MEGGRKDGTIMLKRIQHRCALSEQGARDLIKGCVACVLCNFALILPVALLYFLVEDLMQGPIPSDRVIFYLGGIAVCLALIAVTTWFQYNATYLATYVESGVRRVSLAEKLRRLPLSFFGKKNLSDLTSTIMADCAAMETAFSHYIPELIAAIISTTVIGISLFVFDWRMALAALWVLPVAFCIVGFSAKVQDSFGRKQMVAKLACADGIQECLEKPYAT